MMDMKWVEQKEEEEPVAFDVSIDVALSAANKGALYGEILLILTKK